MNLDSVKQKEFFPGFKKEIDTWRQNNVGVWDVEKDVEVSEHFHV